MPSPLSTVPAVASVSATLRFLPITLAVITATAFFWMENPEVSAVEQDVAEAPILSLAFSPDADNLIAISQAGLKVYRWPSLDLIYRNEVEAASELIVNKVETPHTVSFSPLSNILTIAGGIASQNGAFVSFSWPDFQPLQYSMSHQDSVMETRWLDGKHLVTASMDGEIQIREAINPSSPLKLIGHSKGVTSICVADDQHLISGGVDSTLRVWNLETYKLERTLNQHSGVITDLAPSPLPSTHPVIASASEDHSVRFWQPTIGRLIRFTKLNSTPLRIAWVVKKDLAPTNLLIAACSDGTLRIIDPQNATVIKQMETGLQRIFSLAIHPSDYSAVVGGDRGQIMRIKLDLSTQHE